MGFENDRVGVDGYDADRLAKHFRKEYMSLLVGVGDITGKSCESEVWALRQDDRSLETLQPLVRFLGLQLDQES